MYIRAKQHRASFPSQTYKPTQPFTLICSDVLWTSQVTTTSGKRWFVTFIDDHIRLNSLLTDKFEVSSIFQQFYTTIETPFNAKIAILLSDNGHVFLNNTFRYFLFFEGIVHQSSCAYNPQQDDVVERKKCHLLEVALSLMLSTSLPYYL